MAAKVFDWLPESVLFASLTVPEPPLKIAAPEALVWLPDKVTLSTVSVPRFLIAPPLTLVSALLRVKPETAALTFAILKMLNKGVPPAALRWMVSTFAPGPWKVRFLSTSSSPEVSVIGEVTWPEVRSKVIVLPGQALAMIPRSEPAPLSLLLVTMVGAQLTEMVKL